MRVRICVCARGITYSKGCQKSLQKFVCSSFVAFVSHSVVQYCQKKKRPINVCGTREARWPGFPTDAQIKPDDCTTALMHACMSWRGVDCVVSARNDQGCVRVRWKLRKLVDWGKLSDLKDFHNPNNGLWFGKDKDDDRTEYSLSVVLVCCARRRR